MYFKRSGRSRIRGTNATWAVVGFVCTIGAWLSTGCSWTRPSLSNPIPVPVFSNKAPNADSQEGTTETKSAENESGGSITDYLPASTVRMVSFAGGKTENLARAQKLYQQANDAFVKAQKAPKEEQADLYADAAKIFKDAQTFAPPALIQDAMFMEGESLFMSDQLTEARDVFETLQKDYPRNPHTDRTASRLFTIAKYWIDVDRAGGESWGDWLNPLDAKVPWLDSTGHAVKVLDQMRFDDPTGRLADDATMAAAVENIRQGEFEMADEFLTDLRETFTDSDHLFLAHLLGIHCKLQNYAGPDYSGLDLEEAEKLIQQTRSRFPRETSERQYAERLARASAEVDFHQAQRLAHRATFNEKQKQFGAAREYYQRILRDHPTTPQAETARERLAKIGEMPAKPSKPLGFMTRIFPDARVTKPLETVESDLQKESEKTESESEENGGSFFPW